MTNAEIIKQIKEYQGSEDFIKIKHLYDMYEGDNPKIIAQGNDRRARRKKPNNVIPTAYYSTVVDTMAGYMFQDVQYNSDDETAQINLDDINEANNIAVEDMQMGVASLAMNKAVEYVYTDDSGNIKINKLSTLNTIINYSDTIDAQPINAINFVNVGDNIYRVLYVEANLERTFYFKDDKDYDEEERLLFFSALPVIDYHSQIIGKKAPFEVCIPYIQALDALVSGNANEIERLVDALLVLGRQVNDEDLQNMDEWKVLQDMKTEDRAEYLTKDTSPEFRRYVSELLIREIHKHSHVIDWYSADNGQTQDASGKALRTRLFDMDMYSKRIEMAYREGVMKRLQVVGELAELINKPIGEVKVTFKRTMIDDFLDDAAKLSMVPFISDITKREYLGIDEQLEQERLLEERPAQIVLEDDNDIL